LINLFKQLKKTILIDFKRKPFFAIKPFFFIIKQQNRINMLEMVDG
jgi:hypothetical protein